MNSGLEQEIRDKRFFLTFNPEVFLGFSATSAASADKFFGASLESGFLMFIFASFLDPVPSGAPLSE
jgi:hypothetical protein